MLSVSWHLGSSWHTVQLWVNNPEECTLDLRKGLETVCPALLLRDQAVFLFLISPQLFSRFTSAPAGSWHSYIRSVQTHKLHTAAMCSVSGGEMISIGLLLMRLVGSLAGVRCMGSGLRARVSPCLSVHCTAQHIFLCEKLLSRIQIRRGNWTWRITDSKSSLIISPISSPWQTLDLREAWVNYLFQKCILWKNSST